MYFASLSYEGQDSVSLGAADGTQYINGSAYRNQMPIDAQLAFQLGHEKWTLISGLGKELAGWLWNILVGLLLFVVPGWGIMSWLLPGWYKNDGLERLLFSFCFTSALFPIIFLWAKLGHISLGPWLPITFLLIGFGLILLNNIKKQKSSRTFRENSQSISKNLLFNIIFIIVLGGVILSRFWVVRNLDLPLWGDSYHHSLIVQLLNENKGLFDNWLPYADLYGFSYHYGFHAVSVTYQWIIGASSPRRS